MLANGSLYDHLVVETQNHAAVTLQE